MFSALSLIFFLFWSGSHFNSFFVDIFSIGRLRNGSHVTFTLIWLVFKVRKDWMKVSREKCSEKPGNTETQPRLQGALSLAQRVRVRGFTENEERKSDAKGADAGKRRERKRPWYRLLKNIQNLDIFLWASSNGSLFDQWKAESFTISAKRFVGLNLRKWPLFITIAVKKGFSKKCAFYLICMTRE